MESTASLKRQTIVKGAQFMATMTLKERKRNQEKENRNASNAQSQV
jgi:hypothetical protein